MKSINSLINTIKNRISNNDSVKKIEEATNKILHKEDKEVYCCNNTDNKNTEKVEELNKIKIVQPSSSSILNRSDDVYHLFRPQDNINSYDSSLIMRNVDKCKGTNENIKNSKRIQLYKNKGDISNFNTTIRTNLNKFKIDLSKDLRYKFLNKYGAKDDFNFDIYIFPPPPGTIPSGYYQIPGDITKWRTGWGYKITSGPPADSVFNRNSYSNPGHLRKYYSGGTVTGEKIPDWVRAQYTYKTRAVLINQVTENCYLNASYKKGTYDPRTGKFTYVEEHFVKHVNYMKVGVYYTVEGTDECFIMKWETGAKPTDPYCW